MFEGHFCTYTQVPARCRIASHGLPATQSCPHGPPQTQAGRGKSPNFCDICAGGGDPLGKWFGPQLTIESHLRLLRQQRVSRGCHPNHWLESATSRRSSARSLQASSSLKGGQNLFSWRLALRHIQPQGAPVRLELQPAASGRALTSAFGLKPQPRRGHSRS